MEKDQSVQKRQADPEQAERTHTRPLYTPLADIRERADAITVALDMPGADESTIDCRYEDGVLRVRATAVPQHQPGLEMVYSEYGVGDYERAFTLAEGIDITKVDAQYKDGVLTLTLPKAEEAKPRRITIKTE